MPVPKTPDGQIDVAKLDAILDSTIQLCDVMHRQIVAIASIAAAMKSDAAATFTLPDPPAHLMPQTEPEKK